MYNHELLNATVFQPANQATILGPKSLAGLKPACVKGAKTQMSPPTVKPIRGGTNPSFTVSFFGLVNAKMTNARIAVPTLSARKAVVVVTGELKIRF
jgi:hypothetical protein